MPPWRCAPSRRLFDGASRRAVRGRTALQPREGRPGRDNDRGRRGLHSKRSSRMRNVQGLGPKMNTTKLRAIAQSFLEEMYSPEEFLKKMKPADDKKLAT